MKRWMLWALLAGVLLAAPAQASADGITQVFAGETVSGNPIPCSPISFTDLARVCHGTYNNGPGGSDLRLRSFDGIPLEVYVILPPAPGSGQDGPYPLVVQSHGWGGSAGGLSDTQYYGPTADSWAHDGYAVLQLTARGFGASCGGPVARGTSAPACAGGYIRLDDDRYEVRDIQNAVGLLVDQAVADPGRIGVTGESYGGGVSLQLSTLKDRVMNPDGTFSPWTSPAGTPLHIAAGAPVIPWSDLVYSLLPNGRTLDYQVTPPTADLSPIGIEKQSFVSGLFALGAATGYYSHTDSQANLPAWLGAINAGEPYDSNPQDVQIAQQIAKYHSAYYLLDGAYGAALEPPAPLLIANGFTDDLFPVDEAVRYYNLDQAMYPSDPIKLVDGDFGHMRGQNKAGDLAYLSGAIQAFFDHYVKGTGSEPGLGATAFIETCPGGAASGGPVSAPSWSALHPGEVDYSAAATQTVTSASGDPSISKTIDPLTGSGACATVKSADQGSGVATYRLPAATGSGYTLLGSATVIADLETTGTFPMLAARLWDVDPASGTETLVARGLYRLDPNAPDGLQVFQLHPGAWHFAAGHIPKLELLGADSPYARTSNGDFSIDVHNLQLRLPVHEAPGTSPAVGPPLPPVTPHPHPPVCRAYPVAKIGRGHTRASRNGLSTAGTAHEHRCPNAPAGIRARQHVVHVFVIVYRRAAHGRCRFLEAGGRVSRARSCRRPIEFRARGARRWRIQLKIAIPRGKWLVATDAVDALHHREPRALASGVLVTIH